ncbi:MAG: putative membrane protein YhiD involved in acid resistance, partial [Kiritimatiellia bacterium]
SAKGVSGAEVVCAMVMAYILCSVIATVYRWTFQGLSYSRSFVHAQVLGGMIVAMLIMAIGNNLARGLGILGTLAIVRFRTPIRDTRDMIFLFAALGIGIACGAQTYIVAILGTICISIAVVLLHWSPFASRRAHDGLLRFTLPMNSPSEDLIKSVLQETCASFALIAMREAVQGDMMEYSYQIRLLDPSYQSDVIDRLHEIDDVAGANLLLQRTTVEL